LTCGACSRRLGPRRRSTQDLLRRF